jgi:signal transduction histidine kinase
MPEAPLRDATSSTLQARQREVLRQASVALRKRVVTLWEVSAGAEVIPVLTSVPQPAYHAAILDVDGTLRHWGAPIIQGSRWVGCRLDDAGHWCVAPVRAQPAAPPPGGAERRSPERLTLELAGLCVGLLDRPDGSNRPRLPEAEALVELSRHPSVIAHEVANPLTAALMSLDLCIEALRGTAQLDPDFRAERLEELAEVALGMTRAIAYLRSIQDRARGALARSERFDAVQVVRSCVTLERPLARTRGVVLDLEAPGEAIYLLGDPNTLYHVLTNLIHNAVDASVGSRSAVGVSVERTGEAVRLVVRDRGAGIVSEHLGRIFEPGFTTKPFGAGSGMGLPVVQESVQRMFGGRVEVQSAVGEGSVLTVTLPIPPQRPARRR